jgi:hypothetical protein
MSEKTYNGPPGGDQGPPPGQWGVPPGGHQGPPPGQWGVPPGGHQGPPPGQWGGAPGGYQGGDPMAQAKAEKAYRKAQRPLYKKKRVIFPAAFLALIIVIVAANSGGGKDAPSLVQAPAAAPAAPPAQAPAAPKAAAPASSPGFADVAITSCAADEFGYAEAGVRITNGSSKASNYMVTVTFNSNDGTSQVGTGLVAVNSLQPGQHSDEKANALKQADGAFTCSVNPKDVTRYAA